ncbi:MAG TPA: hypothetical protein VF384_00865 [Planctomycetota bacterium]
MIKLLLPLALAVASPVTAQNCFDGDFGTRLGGEEFDVIFQIQPIGFPFPIGGVNYNDIHVTTHGFATLSNNGVPAPPLVTTLFEPTLANFFGGPPKVCALYADIVVPEGSVYIKSTPTQCTVTWENAECYFVDPQVLFTLQMTLYPSGVVRFTYGPGVTNNSAFVGTSAVFGICGITPGGGATPIPAVDLSAGGATTTATTYEIWVVANTFDMANNSLLMTPTFPGYSYSLQGAPTSCAAKSNYGAGCDGLELGGHGLPTIGNSSFNLIVSGIPIVSPVALLAFGNVVVDPGVSLSFLGMPGCEAYTNLGIGIFNSGMVSSQRSEFALAIPNNPAINGTVLSAQALSLSATILPLGFASSNGTRLVIGLGH